MYLLALLSLSAASASAVLGTDGSTIPSWHAPQPGDVRSPCPALNAMANHGLIPHSGKGLSSKMLLKSMAAVWNVSDDLGKVLVENGMKTSNDPDSGTFDLDNLNKHGIVEHDVSLSRSDKAVTGDNHSFNQTIFDETMAAFKHSNHTSIKTAAKARYNRIQTSRRENSHLNFGPDQKKTSFQEMGLLLGGMGDIKDGVVSLEYVRVWFEEERLPSAEGWQPPKLAISMDSLGALVDRLKKATPEDKSPELIVQTYVARERGSSGAFDGVHDIFQAGKTSNATRDDWRNPH